MGLQRTKKLFSCPEIRDVITEESTFEQRFDFFKISFKLIHNKLKVLVLIALQCCVGFCYTTT